MPAKRLLESPLAGAIPAAIIALLVSGLLVAIAGVSPISAYKAIWEGGLGSSSALGATAVATLPLLFAALAFAVTFRAGLYNIGIEGQLYMGALASTVVGLYLHAPRGVVLPAAVIAGMLAGMAWGILPALLKVWRGVNEIVSSLFLSYIAIYIVGWLVSGPLEAPGLGVAQSEVIPEAARFPEIIAGSKLTWAILVALVAVILVWLLFRTPFGVDLRVLGGSRRVADYVGIDVSRTTIVAFAISGALGGLAGSVELLGNQYSLSPEFSPGWGYTGIAVAVLGAGAAWGIASAALFFGLIGAAAVELQFTEQLSPDFAVVVQAVALIVVLLGLKLQGQLLLRRSSRQAMEAEAGADQAAAAGGATVA
ncbi:MAG: ABC transporter permease [Actinobacteria bacterium]|nr:ABC transporter permease [Actinomycetota bacterium]